MVSNKFTTTSPVIASFDFQEIATGEGFVDYYPALTQDSVGTDYILTGDSSTYSDEEQVTFAFTKDNDTTYRKQLDLDFDLSEYQLSQTFEGTAHIGVTWSVTGASADSNGMYIIFKIRKWDPDTSTETEIASVQTETKNDDDDPQLKTSLLDVAIPQTVFPAGTVLRLTAELWSMNDSSIADLTGTMKIDPANRNGSATNPNFLKLRMPKRIE